MCKFCENYDFSRVGYGFACGDEMPSIYLAGGISRVPEDERFKFCPVCGESITEEKSEK